MSVDIQDDPDYRVWMELRLARDAVHKARERELKGLADISVIEAGVLFYVQVLGIKANLSEIGRWLFRDRHSMSALITRMEKKGLLKKSSKLTRGNMVSIELTEKGTQAFDEARKIGVIRRIISSLSKKEREQLSKCLRKMRNRAMKELEMISRPTLTKF